MQGGGFYGVLEDIAHEEDYGYSYLKNEILKCQDVWYSFRIIDTNGGK